MTGFLNFASVFALFCLLIFTTNVNACDAIGTNERLSSFCFLEELDDKVVTEHKLGKFLSKALKQGVNLNNSESFPKYWYNYDLSPYLGYDSNFNGGSPRKPLIINGLKFSTASSQLKAASLGFGMSGQAHGKVFWGAERGISAYYSKSIERSPTLDVDKTSQAIRLCTENHISNGFYLDYCEQEQRSVRDYSRSQVRTRDLKFEHVSAVTDSIWTSSVSFTKSYVNTDGYNYTDSGFHLTFLNPDSQAFDLSLVLSSESDANALTPLKNVTVGISDKFRNKRYRIGLSHQARGGLQFFGSSITQDISTLDFRMDFVGNSQLVFSASDVSSNLDYFSDKVVAIRFETGL